ncbi:MAPK regulated corepressor interacting protein 2 isoform X1 [Kogia breviceps]|uniref:MAPK regulated corepressor interacting protein 2 isoform X1 n=1 Tax=Kogia breviceps TaxID=27615 RepID=UPI0034D3535C
MYTITKGPSKLVAQRRTGAQRGRARSHAAAGGEQARRAPEMPASRAADPAAPTGTAAGTLAPVESRAEARVQSGEWPAATCHIPVPQGNPGDLHTGPRGERPICVRRLRTHRPGRVVGTAVPGQDHQLLLVAALEGTLPVQGLALPHTGPSARRGPRRPVHLLWWAVLHPGPGQEPATPEVPEFGLLLLLTPWPSCSRLPEARG